MKDSFPRHALCPPHPKVTKSIRAELKKRGFNNQDRQMRSVTAELGSEPIPTIGINDGVFYPEDSVPLLPQTRGLTPSQAVRKRPTTGKLRLLVLLADFADNEGRRDPKDFSAMLFSKGVYKTGSMRDFYLENSYNQLDLDGQVIGWLRLPQSYTFYVGSDNGTGAFPNNSQKMVEDALRLAAQQIDFKQFDDDGDAFLDGLFVVFAGGGAESEEDLTKRPMKMWSHQSHLPTTFESQGIKAFAYCVVPEDGRVGVFSHEFGHMLGLPDLYDTTYNSSGVGVWCIMGAGEWNNDGLTPGHFCAWSKAKLEWITPQNVKAETTLKLPPVQEDKTAVYRVWEKGKSGDEYFLIENRQRKGFDAKLPAAGLLVWHIDDSQLNNNNPGHYRVGLQQADGTRQLELARNDGDPGDPYPGKAKNTSLSPTSNPASNDVLGRQTGVSISNIKHTKGVISCKVKV